LLLPYSCAPTGPSHHHRAGKHVTLLKLRITKQLGIAFVACLVAASLTDRSAAAWAQHLPASIVRAGLVVSFFGTAGFMLAASALLAFGAFARRGNARDGRERERLTLLAHRAAFFLLAIAVSGIGVQIVKHLIGRARPRLLAQMGTLSFHPFTSPDAYASFPSGHTASAFAAATALSLMLPRYHRVLFLCATAIGLSRIVVGQHYPSDVLAGAAFGFVVALGMARSAARRGLALFPGPGMLRDG
jgi:membrane-associated phospholipid phosphatase